jgi:cytochrome bd ubiquinol oxidase subunit II
MTLQATWYILLFVLLIGYAILDGIDLGVGILHLTTRDDRARRTAIQAIGPTWDGNEVWLLTGGGALFAAFPPVYATVFSGFYLALVLLLVALIGRAVAIEFRSRVDSPVWQHVWDGIFWFGSFAPALLLGVALGNIVRGIPLDASGNYAGTFFELLNPHAVLIGLTSVMLFTLQGSLFLAHKTEGPMQEAHVRRLPLLGVSAFGLLAASASITLATCPHLTPAMRSSPLAWGLATLAAASLVAVFPLIRGRRFGTALVASSAAIAGTMGLAATTLFPRLVPSSTDLSLSLTIMNSSSTQGTLFAMLVIALVGMPVVLAYTIWVHRLFKGKVAPTDEEGY